MKISLRKTLMQTTRVETGGFPRLGTILSWGSLVLAVGWMVSRVWLGLDFTDEMQYYGEIESLTRTGRFFQDDLFLQQLGYVFVLPFFKLHAFFFPDQSYLLVFGRLLLLAAYGATGARFWVAATKLEFTSPQKQVALAAFFAWIPFQIFAFSYNSTSYLLIVALVAEWITRDPARYRRYAVITAGLLTVLTYTHPTGGLVLLCAATAEAAWRISTRAALFLLVTTAVFGLAVFGLMMALHGPDFLSDLLDAINFSRAFGAGEMIKIPTQFACLLILAAACAVFVQRRRVARAASHLPRLWSASSLTRILVTVLVATAGTVLQPVLDWRIGYLAVSVDLTLMLVLASGFRLIEGRPFMRQTGQLALFTGGAVLLLRGLEWGTGNYATTVFLVVLIILAASSSSEKKNTPEALAIIGTIAGTVFAITSSNGTLNFGVGAAGVIPFLVLYATRSVESTESSDRKMFFRPALLSAIAGLLLLNGVLNPYREQLAWNRFQPVSGVPVFSGLRTSPFKVEAIRYFRQAVSSQGLEKKSVLVLGPQPWLYFVLGGRPTTPMFFMHYSDNQNAYNLVAERLFRNGFPDVIVLTNLVMPSSIAAQLAVWVRSEHTVQILTLPPDLLSRHRQHTDFPLSPQMFLLESQGTAGASGTQP